MKTQLQEQSPPSRTKKNIATTLLAKPNFSDILLPSLPTCASLYLLYLLLHLVVLQSNGLDNGAWGASRPNHQCNA